MSLRARLFGAGALAACMPLAVHAQTFTPYAAFPAPAPGSFTIVGGAMPDGRLLLWNGADLYLQTLPYADAFNVAAQGYKGDPAFVAFTPDKQTAYLGAGFDNAFSPDPGTNGEIYRVDPNALANFAEGAVVANQGSYAGVMLNDTLLLIDAGRADFSGSDLLILDMSGAKSADKRTVVRKPDWPAQAKTVVAEKPPFAYSSSLTADYGAGVVYAMDGNTRELRRFAIADLVAAFQGASTLDWAADGVLLGAAGDYFSGGVAGINSSGDLIVPGSLGFGQPGGIQLVDPATGAVVDTLDPSGTQEFVSVVYNDVLGVISAFAGNTQQAYAEGAGFPAVPAAGVVSLAGLSAALLLAGIARRRGA